uniref:Small ribosomal subunit protein mS26 n=1 Tax=Haemonchus contortus TaxID=6289 RepID=A0A7I4YB74_HAECO|nr:Hypothetical protein CBG21170 [Haemonchus contortus]
MLGQTSLGRRLLTAEVALCVHAHSRNFRRRPPNQGKPPILPPSKKVLYHVVHVPWQSPEDVKELLWRRHVYNNAVISLKEIFRQEIRQAEAAGKGVESMREEEDAELNRLIAENERVNREMAEARARKEEEEWKETQREILKEIDEALQKQHSVAKEATAEVRDAIARSRDFVNEENLEAKIMEALENPKVYDFAIDRQGKKYYDPPPSKYQEGVPTRQKGRLFDRTLGTQQAPDVKEDSHTEKLADTSKV